jgi:outer membrane protein assembly factor BamB
LNRKGKAWNSIGLQKKKYTAERPSADCTRNLVYIETRTIHPDTGNWCCIDWKTGKKVWEQSWNGKGSIIAADGMLYIYDERQGNVGLVKAIPEKFDLVSSFKITQGNAGPFWAHPVIRNGILYIRHTNALMAYNVKAK